jgi:nitric oxide reductase NorD protein
MVLSDGKPYHGGTHYVGEYAIEDTKKAIEEARKAGIKPFGIVVGKQSRKEFERMYGRDFVIIKNVIELPDLLPIIYRRLTGI